MLIKNQWYAIEFGPAVCAAPLKVPVHGHDLVLYRAGDGTVRAQSDLCVHRGGSLSGGTVIDDCLQCPYHGWRYDGEGRCVRIPANRPDAPIPRKARIDTYPCVERYGFVWVFLGDAPEPERPPLPDSPALILCPSRSRGGLPAVSRHFSEWHGNYDRLCWRTPSTSPTRRSYHAGSFGQPRRALDRSTSIWSAPTGRRAGGVTATVDLKPAAAAGHLGARASTAAPRAPAGAHHPRLLPRPKRLDVNRAPAARRDPPPTPPRCIDEAPHDLESSGRSGNFLTGSWADPRLGEADPEDLRRGPRQRGGSAGPNCCPSTWPRELHVKSDSIQLAYRRWRQDCLDRGLGLLTPSDAEAARRAAVIASPARAEDPEMAGAWVFGAIPSGSVPTTADPDPAPGRGTTAGPETTADPNPGTTADPGTDPDPGTAANPGTAATEPS